MAMKTLEDAFLMELQDMLHAEKQILKALPKMAKTAINEELKAGFESHLAETEEQVSRLEQAFKHLNKAARGKKCKGMEGIIEEGKEGMEEAEEQVLDAVLIAAAQKVEHYEITSYGTLIAWAETLGHSEIAELLQQNLAEEKAADEKLSQLSEHINEAAAAGMEEEAEEEEEEEEATEDAEA